MSKKVNLGEVCDLHNGFAFKSSDYTSSGYFLIRITNVKKGYVSNHNPKYVRIKENSSLSKFILKKDDILISLTGDVGRVGIINQKHLPCALNQRVAKVTKINKNKIDSRYLFYFLNSQIFRNQVEEKAEGTAQQNISTKQILQIDIQLPSLQKQNTIVKTLDEIAVKIKNTVNVKERNIKNVEDLFKKYLNTIFKKLNKTSDIKKISKVCDEIFAGGDVPKDNFSKIKNDKFKVPIIANAVKNNGVYGFTNIARVKKPSITIAARGSATGHTVLRNHPFFPIIRIIVLTPNSDIVWIEYLKYCIKNLNISIGGSAIPQLTVPMLKKYSISLPSLKDQKFFSSKLDLVSYEIEKLKIIYKKKIDLLDEFKEKLIKKNFSS